MNEMSCFLTQYIGSICSLIYNAESFRFKIIYRTFLTYVIVLNTLTEDLLRPIIQ